MRYVIITDIHGNINALDAVLDEIFKGKSFDKLLVLGDIASSGPDPCEVVQRLQELKKTVCISGNADRWITRGVTLSMFGGKVTDENVQTIMRITRSCGWTEALLMNEDKLEWLKSLPPQYEISLPDGKRILAVHGSPNSDEKGFEEKTPENEQENLLQGCSADILVAGHTHVQYHNRIGRTEIHVIPSVSLPKGRDKSAAYAILNVINERIELSIERVAYDYNPVIERARRRNHPALQRIVGLFS